MPRRGHGVSTAGRRTGVGRRGPLCRAEFPGGRAGPLADRVKLGGGGGDATTDVVTHPFELIEELELL